MTSKPSFRLPLIAASLALAFGSAHQASAGLTLPDEILVGQNGLFRVGEFGFDAFGPEVHYLVDVLDPGVSIHALAFSFVSSDPANVDIGAGSLLPDWGGIFVDEADWATHSFLIGANPATTGASLGAFDDLFGTLDDIVALYWDTTGTTPLNEANDLEESGWDPFGSTHADRFGDLLGSEAIAVDLSGTIIDASLPSALTSVPEASESAIIALGAFCLLAHRRRRKTTA